MKTKTTLLLFFSFIYLTAQAQLNQRFDNVNYKSLYLKGVAKLIQDDPHLLILDVRSPGEFAGTSTSVSLNMGRLKGAVNIPIDSIKNHLKDLEPYKDKNILVYCSHSNRSRVVSKLLSDNGFKKINNLNGGISLINKSTDAEFPLKPSLFTTNLPYKLIQSEDAYRFIRNKNNLIIDVRPASEFNGTDTAEENNIGRIKNAINIPANELGNKMGLLPKNKTQPLLLYDLHSSESSAVALKLSKAGFKNVYVLFEGLSTLLLNTPTSSSLRNGLFVNFPKYKVIGSKETIDMINSNPRLIVADLRPAIQFENKSDMSFMNLGHIKNAVNLSTEPQLYTYLKGKSKTGQILVYGSGMTGMAGMPVSIDVSNAAKRLSAMGFTKVYMVYSGLYPLIWSVTNMENCRNGFAILTDHKGLY